MLNIKAVGGFDRELELTLLYQGKRFYYLPDTFVFDENPEYEGLLPSAPSLAFSTVALLQDICKILGKSACRPQLGFCDKMFQQVSIPRLLLLGFTFFLLCSAHAITGCGAEVVGAFALLVAALLIAVPKRFYTRRLAVALLSLPYTFLLMAANIFKLRGANKNFIHTRHGVG